MEDWDLQAIVRGYTSESSSTNMILNSPSSSCFAAPNLDILEDCDLSLIFSDFYETTTDLDHELEGLHKPCSSPVFPQTVLTTSISFPRQVKQPQKQHQINIKNHTSPASKSKTSKKNQQNRIVQQVKADNLSSDMWAWRKYGQKPIKGSPYPRSYYRCSSSKGCSARKQVERSNSDPAIFLITYTAEHNHTHPTRRNSLAGSTRTKLSSTPKNTVGKNKNNNIDGSPDFLIKKDFVSPKSLNFMLSSEEEVLHNVSITKDELISEGKQAVMPHQFIIPCEDSYQSLDLEDMLFV